MSTTGGETSLISRLTAMAAKRRPDDDLFCRFITAYLIGFPDFDFDDRDDDEMYAAISYHFKLAARRPRGRIVVDVRSPSTERDGWDADFSYIFIVTDDMPFLVDTMRIVLERHHLRTHRLIPPMLMVTRVDDEITDIVLGQDIDGPDQILEAWTQVQIDRVDPDEAAALVADVTAAMEAVFATVGDFEPMQKRMLGLIDVDPLLGWLAADHYVFLGAATYRLDPEGNPHVIESTALGSLKSDPTPDPPLIATLTNVESIADTPEVAVARTAARSIVHRPARMTVVTVRRPDPDAGKSSPDAVVYERFVGLPSSAAYRSSVLDIPTVGDRAREVLGLASFGSENYVGRALRNVLETLPRMLVFELSAHTLAELVFNIVGLQERQIVRIFEVPEPLSTATTVMVFLPRERFTAQLPEQVANFVGDALGSPYEDVETFVNASSLARITLTLTDRPGVTGDEDRADLIELSERLDELTTSWSERVSNVHQRRAGTAAVASTTLAKLVATAPADFQTSVAPSLAVVDLERLAELADGDGVTTTAMTREVDARPDEWRVRVYQRGHALSLTELLPMLSYLGLDALEEHPYEFVVDGETLFLLDIGVRVPADVQLDDERHDEVLRALDQLIAGSVEADGFNQLVLRAGLSTRQVNVLRAYGRYAQQTTFAFSQSYVEETMARLPNIANLLVAMFEEKFDPDRSDAGRAERVTDRADQVRAALDEVRSLDDDRIVRTFLHLIEATVRTSEFQPDRETLAFKFDPALTPDLPQPRPAHEIFVYSAHVEGVHLRGGSIARGGIRWSDRFEDYRTEVLGLVKAQMVKNAVIVPVGAKGGFVVKGIPPTASRDERQALGVAGYRSYVASLLDITDNIVDNAVVHPEHCVRYDGDDPYLVVAADKGTATFSDIANEVSEQYGFWLGDAFASGGSAGYDHKSMGITARGAWESAKRHGEYLGINLETDSFTAVGIGDMSGDVFGNGMLRSRTMRLVAAFDHRHIFVDPDPNAEASFDERRRLFELPRSSWDDYNRDLISDGGGVFARDLKSIAITDPMRTALGLDEGVAEMTPNELISAVLTAPVTMLWNGGVGTYVKSSAQPNGDVGDRQNDAVRVDGDQLRAKMVVEGGNLGITQLGRVEYALRGGLIYTDAIDNSAGVDTSDHEVNIKILLGSVVAAGEMTIKQRNALLHSMTDEVAELVLGDNQAQTLALQIAREQGLPMVNVHARYLEALEFEGAISRALEFLPTDKQLAERQLAGSGLRAPELAVLIAYTKNVNAAEIVKTDLADDPALDEDVIKYFPSPLRKKFRPQILSHRLRREIAITQLVNQMTNLSGISYDHRMTEDTGANVADVARAWLAVREILDFPAWWDEIVALDEVALFDQIELLLDCRRTAERCSLWFIRNRRPPIDIAAEVEFFREPLQQLQAGMLDAVRGPMAASVQSLVRTRSKQSVPEELAQRSAVWHLLHTSFDVVEVARAHEVEPLAATSIYWEMFDLLDLNWLWDGIAALPRADRWQTQARAAQRDDLLTVLAGLASSVLDHQDGSVGGWLRSNGKSFERTSSMLTQIRRSDAFNITNLSVALRQLRNLVTTSVRA